MAVVFDEPQSMGSIRRIERRPGVITRLVIALHLANTPKQAQLVLVVISVFVISVSLYIAINATVSPTPKLSPEEQKQLVDSIPRAKHR